MKQFSQEFPLIHQIAFYDSGKEYVPNEKSLRICKDFGESNYKIWSMSDTRIFLQKQYPGEVVRAFDSVHPYAYKADLARYCIVNFYGGTYLDLSMNSVNPFDVSSYDMVVFRDLNSSNTSWKVSNGIFFSRPGQKILEDAISQCIENISERYYGLDPHFPTGPSVFGRAVARYGPQTNILVGQTYWFKRRKLKFVVLDNHVVSRGKVGGKFLGGQSGLTGGDNYSEVWRKRKVYDED